MTTTALANRPSCPPSTASRPASALWADLNGIEHQVCRSIIGEFDAIAAQAVVAVADVIARGETIDPTRALAYAKRIIGCYRARDFADVDTFAAALVATLSQHAEALVAMVACPLNGLPSTLKFPPAIAEVNDALDATATRLTLVAGAARRALKAEARA